MNPALWISKTGLDAQQRDISVISNNLANASTVGFKKSRAVFEDLLYQNINQPGGQSAQDVELPNGLMIGAGTKVVATQKSHTQGNVQTTDNSLDVMISGKGFFQILMPDGTVSYTRNGQFSLNEEGEMVTSGNGYPLEPAIQIPEDAISVSISQEGEVTVRQPGNADNAVVGQMNLASFINPAGLEPIGQNLYKETAVSGAPLEAVPGVDGMGTTIQGALESSNVNVTEELVNLIESQRGYEMNSKVISSVDQMLSYISQQL
ncbi:MAG: flagellar basal-body rod protein FlgG [Idiomarina sp.]|jgi:flagellar basal-body rod protein FlgG|uniref:Flagellar basal-body rod protein FlgG n=1 Tax=Idiomarina aquatica TaxID=1327752 RepID=A0A4R6PPN8_9GAMM|nr:MULTISPECIES: flagellar basal-body rod protein FlgG [Idiomarina]MBL4742755.1 flagellar basal-body rod protein FlgG [Idiomarina sp.]MBT41659.1 flagellar basal-body rod protein FlgG [Idiomarina sp.]PHQ74324.1 MAG: flagellar basal-body rod protein FlgG [Idiomarina sp.]TDP40335.1 flagellar basal-body rod protein FlgG [Idiomarina aquatica]